MIFICGNDEDYSTIDLLMLFSIVDLFLKLALIAIRISRDFWGLTVS